MNNHPIGAFDSGVGGLSCLENWKQIFPDESVIYFGDVARAPYGDKEPETLHRYAAQITDFLVSNGAKMLVIACNTVSALCADELRIRYPDIPIIDVISPTVSYISQTDRFQKVGVIATKATINSGTYERKLLESGTKAQIFSQSCPLFVPLIENGFREGVVVDTVVAHYLDSFVSETGIDALVLGCTHYPFIEGAIRKLYPQLEIINPSKIVTQQVQKVLLEQNLQAEKGAKAKYDFYASNLSDIFMDIVAHVRPDNNYSINEKTFKGNPFKCNVMK